MYECANTVYRLAMDIASMEISSTAGFQMLRRICCRRRDRAS